MVHIPNNSTKDTRELDISYKVDTKGKEWRVRKRMEGQVLKYNKRDSRIIGMHILQCVE
jgi:hypothetical protein